MGSLTVDPRHNLLSLTHLDTLTGSPIKGDLVYADAVPEWTRLPVGAAAQLLGISAGLPAWSAQTYIDHGSITGLADDDHAQYAKLAGRAGGQVLKGGTGVGENLSLWTNATGTVGTYYLTDLFTDGFVKTSGGTGALSVDTTTYLPLALSMVYAWFMG